jgi:hypothetical protein
MPRNHLPYSLSLTSLFFYPSFPHSFSPSPSIPKMPPSLIIFLSLSLSLPSLSHTFPLSFSLSLSWSHFLSSSLFLSPFLPLSLSLPPSLPLSLAPSPSLSLSPSFFLSPPLLLSLYLSPSPSQLNTTGLQCPKKVKNIRDRKCVIIIFYIVSLHKWFAGVAFFTPVWELEWKWQTLREWDREWERKWEQIIFWDVDLGVKYKKIQQM